MRLPRVGFAEFYAHLQKMLSGRLADQVLRSLVPAEDGYNVYEIDMFLLGVLSASNGVWRGDTYGESLVKLARRFFRARDRVEQACLVHPSWACSVSAEMLRAAWLAGRSAVMGTDVEVEQVCAGVFNFVHLVPPIVEHWSNISAVLSPCVGAEERTRLLLPGQAHTVLSDASDFWSPAEVFLALPMAVDYGKGTRSLCSSVDRVVRGKLQPDNLMYRLTRVQHLGIYLVGDLDSLSRRLALAVTADPKTQTLVRFLLRWMARSKEVAAWATGVPSTPGFAGAQFAPSTSK